VLPKPVDHAELSLYWSLHHFFSHPWHHHVIFAGVQGGLMKLQPETLFHLLASSTWATNLRILDRNIKCTGLEDIRRPSISINDTLHDQRAELMQTLWHVGMTLKWLPPSVRTELDAVKGDLPASKYIGYPDLVLGDILEQAGLLERFLMDSFTLLMSSISVLEAASIKEQARQGQMITRLAFLYVPLSFVTGIFGMNVKEINGSPLPIWVPIASFLIVSVCTLGVYVLWMWKQASR
jgi:Mg2+ and Co2+ transporter CorA